MVATIGSPNIALPTNALGTTGILANRGEFIAIAQDVRSGVHLRNIMEQCCVIHAQLAPEIKRVTVDGAITSWNVWIWFPKKKSNKPNAYLDKEAWRRGEKIRCSSCKNDCIRIPSNIDPREDDETMQVAWTTVSRDSIVFPSIDFSLPLKSSVELLRSPIILSLLCLFVFSMRVHVIAVGYSTVRISMQLSGV